MRTSWVTILTALSMLFAACSGTRGRTPIRPVQVSIQLGSNLEASVTSLTLCLAEFTLVPSEGGTPIAVSLSTSAIAVSNSNQTIATVTLPGGTYDRVDSTLSTACASGKSVELSNTPGSFTLSEPTSIQFQGAFTVDSSLLSLTLDIQPVTQQLKSVSANAQIKTTLETVSGNVLSNSSSVNNHYSAAVLADSPFAYHRFEDSVTIDSKGNAVLMSDSSGFGKNGTYHGSPGTNLQAGAPLSVSNHSSRFGYDGCCKNMYAVAGDKFNSWRRDQNGLGDLPTTFEGWINTSSTGTQIQSIVSLYNEGIGRAYLFGLDATNHLFLNFYKTDGSAQIGKASSAPLSPNTWYHVVATYDGSETEGGIKLYLNGILISTTSTSSGVYTGMSEPWTFPTVIGARSDLVWFFNGYLDEIAAYDHVLDATRIADHYANK